ncbi:hypothetical protein V8F06_007599 [Rhypophila decipiens]
MTQSTTATCIHRGESSSILGKMRLPSILNPAKWPYASGSELDSVGRFLGTVSLYRILSIIPVRLDCWEATGPARRVFSNRLGLEIAEYLDCNSDLCESGSIFHMSLYMVGASRSRAKPTLMFVSGDAKVRKDAFNTIKQSKILDAYPGFALAHIPLEAEYENFQQLAGVKGETRIDQTTTTDNSPTVSVLTNRNSGNSGRRLYFSDEIDGKNRERAATAGGIVSFHGRPMFLTVCHAASDTHGPDRQKQADEDDKGEITGFSELELGSQESGDENLVVVTSRGSESPKSSLSSADETSSVFSSPAESAESPRESTQQKPPEPAPRYPQTFGKTTAQAGHVVLSSSEWDCLLVSVHWTLLPDASLGQNTSQSELPWIPLESYSAMIEPEAQDTRITTTTPDGGTIGGILSGTPSFVRLPFFTKFKQIYTATFDKPLAPGDCGCWVRDATTGKLFGHVISGSPTTGLATIIPASRLFPYLLSQLEGKEPDQASSTSQISDKRLSETAAEPAKPVNTDSKKRRASGGLQGLWSSFKKTTGSKGASAGPLKEENATDVVSKNLAESAVVATTALVCQDDKKLEQEMKDDENQKDPTNSDFLVSVSSFLTNCCDPSPYDPPIHTFSENLYSTGHIPMGGPSAFLCDESCPSRFLYDNDGSYPPSLSMTRDSSAASVVTPCPELVLQSTPVEVAQYAGVYSNEYSFRTRFESDLKGPGFVGKLI